MSDQVHVALTYEIRPPEPGRPAVLRAVLTNHSGVSVPQGLLRLIQTKYARPYEAQFASIDPFSSVTLSLLEDPDPQSTAEDLPSTFELTLELRSGAVTHLALSRCFGTELRLMSC